MIRRTFILLVLAVAFASPALALRPFTPNDLLSLDRVSNPQVSRGGALVAYEVSSLDLAANRRFSTVWLMKGDGSGANLLTPLPDGGSNPVFSADGTEVYFVSGKSGSDQVWRVSVAGGDPVQVTRFPLPVANLKLSPDGKSLAFTTDVFPDCDSMECTVKKLDEKAKAPSSGVLYETIFVRHWNVWADGRRSHLFVTQLPAATTAVDLSKGMGADVPSKPDGGPEEFTFTPDSLGMVFASRNVGRAEPWSTNFDLWVAPVDGSREAVDITAENRAWDSLPAFSPDGKTLAYQAQREPGYESDRFRLVLRSWESRSSGGRFDFAVGPAEWVSEKWDRSAEALTWADGRTVTILSTNLGQRSLFAFDVVSRQVRTLSFSGTVDAHAVGGGKVFFTRHDISSPADVFSVNLSGTGLAQLTAVNAHRLADVEMGRPEQFAFMGAKGETVFGYVVRPPGAGPASRFPVAFIVHGGPEISLANAFNYRWNAQTFAGAGFGVVMVDFHGSLGYGEAFTRSIIEDWGGKPLRDLQLGLDAAISRYSWLDRERVAALGYSFGGFMMYWIAGNWPQPFRAIVAHAGIFNTGSFWATDELWYAQKEFGGPPWRSPEGYQRFNPANHTERWRVPLLAISNARDYRVPLENTMEAFNTAQRRGIPSQFLYFPDEGHWVLKPANSLKWYGTVLAWIERWTSGPPAAAPDPRAEEEQQ